MTFVKTGTRTIVLCGVYTRMHTIRVVLRRNRIMPMGNTIGQLAILGLLTKREVAYIAQAAYNQGLQQPGLVDDMPVGEALQLLRKEITVLAVNCDVYADRTYRDRQHAVSQLLLKVIQADEMTQYVLDFCGQAYVERLVEMADGRRVFVMTPQDLTVAELESGMESKLAVVLPAINYDVHQGAL